MKFPPVNFNAMGEADVREEVIAPLLKLLGYRSGGEHSVVREQHLTYPYQSLGRRKKNDPKVYGFADYICTAAAQVNWVIEAKSPKEPLGALTEQQAWSYANHPEIRAVYFVLTNGREFKLFQTNRGPTAEPIFTWSYDEMEMRWQTIWNLLSPEALLHDHPAIMPDTGKPIGSGLRSIARVTGGFFQPEYVSPPNPAMVGMISTVINGSFERNETGGLDACLFGRAPHQIMNELNKAVGHHEMHLKSTDDVLSEYIDRPSIFHCNKTTIVPNGSVGLNFQDWSEFTLKHDIRFINNLVVEGYLSDKTFKGKYSHAVKVFEENDTRDVLIQGLFELHLI